jgi:hypothetical protein
MSVWHLHRSRVMLVTLRRNNLSMGSRAWSKLMAHSLPADYMLLAVMTLYR